MTVDLSTTYMGMQLDNPIVASSSPLTGDLDRLIEMQEAGMAAAVLPSLFEEQIEHESIEVQKLMEFGADSFAEALGGYFPELERYNTGPEHYLTTVTHAKEQLSIPVIASLNGTTRGGWVRWAKRIEDAGADAIELNVYLIPTDPYATAEAVEQRYLDLLEAVTGAVTLPVAVKIGPYFSSLANMARRLTDAGASALVLFNRFYQPDIDLDELSVVPDVQLSESVELRLPLRWVAILHGSLRADLAVTSGVHTPTDVLKALLAGAQVAMMASALLRHGPNHVRDVIHGIKAWLADNEYESIDQLRGSMSLQSAPNPDGYIRSNYMRTLASYTPTV